MEEMVRVEFIADGGGGGRVRQRLPARVGRIQSPSSCISFLHFVTTASSVRYKTSILTHSLFSIDTVNSLSYPSTTYKNIQPNGPKTHRQNILISVHPTAHAMTSSPTPTIPLLLRLPIELREQIYSYLIPRQPFSHPFPSVGITSVTHKPPTLNFLLVHPLLTAELLEYFYQHATFKLILSHAFNFFRVDPDLRHLECCRSLPQLRKIEVVFFCDILLFEGYPRFGLTSFCVEIQRRAQRACEVLELASRLRTVIVSWIDTTQTSGWAEKAGVLQPLRALTETREGARRPITFRVGDVNGPPDMDRKGVSEALREVLGTDARLETGLDRASADAATKMRMLAFDPKQEVRGSLSGT
nr:hypothetical protein CFP56_71609 [Quercus suber]